MAPVLPPNIVQISKLRYDALAGCTRLPSAEIFGEELMWFEHTGAPFLGLVIRDTEDDDFDGIVVARDEGWRFRCVDVVGWYASPDGAAIRLIESLEGWAKRPEKDREQGGKQHSRVDVFTPVVPPSKMNAAFVRVSTVEGFTAARELIEAMMPYYEDVDGNFVEQFQSTAFDSRFWELYLFALLTEAGFIFDRTSVAPDFLCMGLIQSIFVEAITVNPTRQGNIVTEPALPAKRSEIVEYFKQYMPIKWGSALTSKLHKEYWTLPHVQGKPIVLAIQDFHVPRAMVFTHSTLVPYLYGVEFAALYDDAGKLQVKARQIHEHKWKDKRIESGFFYLQGAENISAVIHNPTATISKFNRMGYLAGFGSKEVRMLRFGTRFNPDPQAALPLRYYRDVNSPDYCETWEEGLNVYHNPNARHPLHPYLFGQCMNHNFREGQLVSTYPDFHPFTAETVILSPKRLQD